MYVILSSPDVSPVERTTAPSPAIIHTHLCAFVRTRTLGAPITYDYQNYSTNLKISSTYCHTFVYRMARKCIRNFRCYYMSLFFFFSKTCYILSTVTSPHTRYCVKILVLLWHRTVSVLINHHRLRQTLLSIISFRKSLAPGRPGHLI